MLCKLNENYIGQVVSIHLNSWYPSELSIKLGKEYIRMFYNHIIYSKHSFGYVYTKNDNVIAYATGFNDYNAFNKNFEIKHINTLFPLLLRRFLNFHVSPLDIFNIITDYRKLRKARFPLYHLGALALKSEFKGTEDGSKAIIASIDSVINEFRTAGYLGCWGLCDLLNAPMRKLLIKLGFEEIDVISFWMKKVVLYEMEL